jgi:serine phosphatase RsbU (regulator of sigma subunit)
MMEDYKNIEFDSVSSFYPIPSNLALPFQNNNVSFEFCAIHPSKSYLVKYQYMLEGYDKTWSPVSNKTNASFGHIPEGTYTFKLKALSTAGIWSDPISYTFKVLPPWHRTWWAYTLLVLICGTSIWLVIRWRTSALQKRQLILEQTVTERTAEVVQQKEVIEEHQKEIIDSINYAKRIQYALLAHEQLLQENLPEYFVLFQPKDIVSGDFYWATKKDNKFYLAVCDCTGHGVPGAFMSLLNISFLNEAINEKNISDPHEVLNYVRKRLIESVSKDGGQDGMDAILICIDKTNNTLSYSAANNAPLLIKNNELLSLVADKMPVGKGERDESFKMRTIDLQKGDSLYLYTDGYADQFGGPKGKKFKYKPLNELFLLNQSASLAGQKNILSSTFEEWKGVLEQVDDVCILGIRI